MKLLLPHRITKILRRKLRGRLREIGGIIVGEHVAPDTFRIIDVSYQKRSGTIAHFVRDPAHHKEFLEKFFARTSNDYTRFNYLGEWHSHPSFDPLPSGEDLNTMFDIIEDPAVGVNFAVLIIARLKGLRVLELSATLFRAGVLPEPINVEVEKSPDVIIRQGLFGRIRSYFLRRTD